MIALPGQSYSQVQIRPVMGLSPDPGFPIWLTPDVDNYLPLVASQTSGLGWIASDVADSGCDRCWLIACDDAAEGGLHLISLVLGESGPRLVFHRPELTLPPPEIAGFRIAPGEGYDWEAIAIHPWSNTVFLSQEGTRDEIAIYVGQVTPGGISAREGAYGRAGEAGWLPGHFVNLRPMELPGWDEAFGDLLSDNLGIEGVACSRDRLFLGLESPYEFSTRLTEEKSTVLAIWSIDPENPSDMEACELLAVHDTADWMCSLGRTVETICGLDAIDSTHIVGVDRDNCGIFAVELNLAGEFVGGRFFFLDIPGPAPLPSDGCPEIDHLPRLIKPSLESLAVVPSSPADDEAGPVAYHLYLAVDPWAAGWTLMENDWYCPAYERRLSMLLPALYRYTVSSEDLLGAGGL